MKYTKISELKNHSNKDPLDGVSAIIASVEDPFTGINSKDGKTYQNQKVHLVGSDGAKAKATIWDAKLFMDRSNVGKLAAFCSTEKDNKKVGVSADIWNNEYNVRIGYGANVTIMDAPQGTQVSAPQQQPATQAQPQQQRPASSAPVNGRLNAEQRVALWMEVYDMVTQRIQGDAANAVTTTIYIDCRKDNIGPTLTQPHAAIAALAPSARKIADEVIAKGGYDADKLPDGDELDAVVDLLIDKAAENISRERLGVAYDAFVAGYPQGKQAAVKAMVSSWEVFLGGVK